MESLRGWDLPHFNDGIDKVLDGETTWDSMTWVHVSGLGLELQRVVKSGAVDGFHGQAQWDWGRFDSGGGVIDENTGALL